MKKLSIIIPVFNEKDYIISTLERVLNTTLVYEMEKEIIITDDTSTDGSAEIINSYILQKNLLNVRLLRHSKNMGKGACIKTALEQVTGEIILIQDADLEYDPNDYSRLLQPILDGHADVVYGSRFIGAGPRRVLFFLHTLGNKFLTFFSNLFTQLNLTDMETGYKVFKTEIIKSIKIKEDRFGFEPEITAKISKIKGISIYETGIAYYGRTYKEGKKIKWFDGLYAIFCIIKYNLFSR